jgi:hypothetical protein
MAKKKKPFDEALFWSLVSIGPLDECWIWLGAYKGEKELGLGYGWYDGVGAHRIAYKLHTGKDIRGKVMGHDCNNPACCNPHHMTPKTHQENMQDAARDGLLRSAPNLNDEEKDRIRELFSYGHSISAIARDVKRDRATVSKFLAKEGLRVRPKRLNNEETAT